MAKGPRGQTPYLQTPVMNMTVIDVKAIRGSIDPTDPEHSTELAERYMNVNSLQDEHVESAKESILKTARTGRKGDGLVYISLVDKAIHIRTGKASS